jgi:hypothetical protein
MMAADDLMLSEAAKRQTLAIAGELGERVKDIVARDLEEAVSKRQRALGQMQQEREDARRERDEMVRATAAERAAGIRLAEENAAKQRRGEELDAAISAQEAALREMHTELDQLTTALAATKRLVRPAVPA